ncbi:MAG TPA: 5'-methylthioadenosine/S-adenosylhomocysteine nucleosidase [Acidimicrobiales bacterium]|nr:5'-methylthioadenosine/S-adenosylhomocysteine nucleosidase [Acidimicrobiales bacterium]
MRFGVLAPMPSELRPVIKAFGLEAGRHGELHGHVGTAGPHEVIATTTGIGTQLAAAAATRMLERGEVDHVVVVGIAGGIGPTSAIRTLVVPEAVEDWPDGNVHRPAALGGLPQQGTIVTSDEYGYDAEVVRGFVDRGVLAVDMETVSVGQVCDARGVPWSAVRAISDPADDDSVNTDVIGLVKPDGSPDVGRSIRYLLRHPWRLPKLAALGRDANAAATVAAQTAAKACAEHEG